MTLLILQVRPPHPTGCFIFTTLWLILQCYRGNRTWSPHSCDCRVSAGGNVFNVSVTWRKTRSDGLQQVCAGCSQDDWLHVTRFFAAS